MKSEILNLKSEIPLKTGPLILLAGLALICCRPPSRDGLTGRASDEWRRDYTLAEGGELQVTNGNGAVDIQAADSTAVDVRAERIVMAATDAAAAEIVPRITIRDEVAPAKISVRNDQLSGIVIGVRTEVRYHVRAPRTALIRIRAVGGPLTVGGFTGRSILTSVNSDLTAEGLQGGVEARTNNGSAKIALSAFGGDLVDVRVTNGSLELTVPARADANLSASVTNGQIDLSAVKFEALGEQNARRVRGRINAGGTPIDLVVVNGNLLVKAGPP